MEIILIRHSETKRDPHVPIPRWGLSERGMEAAQRLGNKNIIKHLDVLYSSLQTKALETAVYLAKPNALLIKTDERLTEVTSFTNKFIPDMDTYEQSLKDYYMRRIQRINGGETKDEALARFNNAIASIVETNTNKESVGIVSHGHILTLFSAQFKDIDPYATHIQIKQPDIAVFNWDKKEFSSFFGDDSS